MLKDKTGILAKYFKGLASADEKKQVENWLSQSNKNQQDFQLYKSIWEKYDNIYENEKPNLPKAWDRINARIQEDQIPLRIINLRKALRIAASILILLGIGLGAYLFQSKPSNTEAKYSEVVSGNQIKELLLADGTIVWLNKNSAIRFPENFKNKKRQVILMGEGYFDVANNPKQPFIVKINNFNVKVLGTEFNINSNKTAGQVEVVVYEGKVAFYEAKIKKEKLVLEMNDKGIGFETENKMVKTTNKDKNNISWKTKEIVFENTAIPEICGILTKHFGKKVEYDTAGNFENESLSASFENQGIEEILEIVCFTLDLSFSVLEGKYVIYKE